MPLLRTIRYCVLALLLCCILTLQYSCDGDGPCGPGEPTNAYFDAFPFRLVDLDGNSLIGVNGTRYENADVTVLGPSGAEANNASASDGGTVSFIPTEETDELEKEYQKDFYLVLPGTPEMPDGDTDTINLVYQLRSTECNDALYDFLRVRYNDSLYFDNSFITPLQFLKK